MRLSQDLSNLTPPLRQYLNPRAVRGAWQNFVIGQTNWSRPWSLYVLNEWVRHHVTDAASQSSLDRGGTFTPPRFPATASKSTDLREGKTTSGCTSLESTRITAMPRRRSIADGRLVAAVEEERFNRVKYAAGFPAAAIRYCLDAAGITLGEVDHIAIPRNPWARLGNKTLLCAEDAEFCARARRK